MNGSAFFATMAVHAAAWGILTFMPHQKPPTPRRTVPVSVLYRKPPPVAVPIPIALPAPPARVRRRAPRKAKPAPSAAPVPLLTAPAAAVPAAAAVVVPAAPPVPAAEALPQLSEEALPEGYVSENGFTFAPLYRVTQPPHLAKPLELKYPDRAREFQKEGVVILEVDVDAKGKVLSARIIEESGWGFGDAALKAVQGAVFVPAKIGDTPVPVRYRIPIRFKMDFS